MIVLLALTRDFWPPVIVSGCALVFTVGSFAWLYARPGRIGVPVPTAYAYHSGQRTLLRFPVVFVNSGARTVVIENVRVVVGQDKLLWHRTRKSLRPTSGDWDDFRRPFDVPPRSSVSMVLEFQPLGDAAPRVLSPGVDVEAKIDVMRMRWRQSREWKTVRSFTLRGHPKLQESGGPFIAYENLAAIPD